MQDEYPDLLPRSLRETRSVLHVPDAPERALEAARQLQRQLGAERAMERTLVLAGPCPSPWNFWYRVYLELLEQEEASPAGSAQH